MNKVESLLGWVEEDVKMTEIDDILEWLKDNEMLSIRGERFAKEFWEYTWHTPKATKNVAGERMRRERFCKICSKGTFTELKIDDEVCSECGMPYELLETHKTNKENSQ